MGHTRTYLILLLIIFIIGFVIGYVVANTSELPTKTEKSNEVDILNKEIKECLKKLNETTNQSQNIEIDNVQ